MDKLDATKLIDFKPSPNLMGTTDGPRGTVGTGGLEARSKAERVLYETHQRMSSVREALAGHGVGGFPEPGELVRLTTFAHVNALSILMRAVEVFGSIELLLASYSINQRAVFALRKLLEDGGISQALILGSDTITWRHPARIREMHETADLFPERVRFQMANSHAKVMGFVGEADGTTHHIVCTGSANLASNSRIEDYVLTNGADGYEHYRSWIEEVAEPLTPLKELEG